MKPYRMERLEKELLRIVNNAIIFKASDHRLQQVTITEVQVSSDMQYAKMFFSFMDDSTDIEEWISILTKASGFLKKEIADTKLMRRIPELKFVYDDTGNRAREVESLLQQVQDK